MKDESKTFTLATYDSVERCILSRAAAVSADGEKLVDGCAGDTEVMIIDATTRSPQATLLRRRSVDDTPSAHSIDDAESAVVSWSQMGRVLSVVSLGDKATPLGKASAPGGALSAAAGRGRRLFFAVDGENAYDGRACAAVVPKGATTGSCRRRPMGKARRRCSPVASPTPRRSGGRAMRRRFTNA